jgi:hypothetical protein
VGTGKSGKYALMGQGLAYISFLFSGLRLEFVDNGDKVS